MSASKAQKEQAWVPSLSTMGGKLEAGASFVGNVVKKAWQDSSLEGISDSLDAAWSHHRCNIATGLFLFGLAILLISLQADGYIPGQQACYDTVTTCTHQGPDGRTICGPNDNVAVLSDAHFGFTGSRYTLVFLLIPVWVYLSAGWVHLFVISMVYVRKAIVRNDIFQQAGKLLFHELTTHFMMLGTILTFVLAVVRWLLVITIPWYSCTIFIVAAMYGYGAALIGGVGSDVTLNRKNRGDPADTMETGKPPPVFNASVTSGRV